MRIDTPLLPVSPAAALARCACAVALAASLAGCVYAPIELGLGQLGELQEAQLTEGSDEQKVLLIPLDGEITGQPVDGLLASQESTTSLVRAQLDRARKDPDIKAVVLRIDSPGGDVTASDHIHHDLLAFRRETNRPVIAYFGDTAASGAYYVAQAADSIVASPTTTTGSIGVLALFFDVHQLAEKVGVRFQAITSGELKDLGSPFREMTAQERAHLKGLIDSMHERFLDVVAAGRKRAGLTREQVAALADGRLFTAQGALEARLVDQIGYLDDALQAAAAAASLDKPCLVAYQRKSLGGAPATVYSALRAGPDAGAASGEALLDAVRALAPRRGPLLRYLWSPLLGAQ